MFIAIRVPSGARDRGATFDPPAHGRQPGITPFERKLTNRHRRYGRAFRYSAAMTAVSSARRVQRVRHEVRQREVAVARVEPLTPNFVSLTFAGAALAGFSSEGFDDHVKFTFPDAPGGEWLKRDYTPRRFDPVRLELTIEFLLHGHGAASEWARSARPGSPAIIGGPKNSMLIPADYPWRLLAGDATALPAICRNLEELPPGVEAFVLVKLDDPADRRELHSAARLHVEWLTGSDDLPGAVRDLQLPEGEGFAWCAGETADMTRARDVLRHEKGHPLEAMRVANYWKAGGALDDTAEG
jgi:NADPH-dependent ferric siderophore reductase